MKSDAPAFAGASALTVRIGCNRGVPMKTKAKFLDEILQYKNFDTELIGRAYVLA